MLGAGLTGTGSGGADTLLSSGGANILVGLGGNDLYYVNNSGDTVTEAAGGGFDTVAATVNYALPAEVEALYMIGSGLTGTGSGNADRLLSSGGANILVGLGGDDLYYVNNTADVVTEAANGGFDSVHGIRQLHPADQCRGAVHEWFRADRYRQQRRRHTGHPRREHSGWRRRQRQLRVPRRQRQRRDRCRLRRSEGDVLVFSGFGTAAQDATFTQIGAPTNGRSIPASMPTTRPSRSRTAPWRMQGISFSCEVSLAHLGMTQSRWAGHFWMQRR